ncbi:uncharacterized protein BYT42DRAFT_488957 [Radiomyces spectabilis]|uniref:uncharacterized protein n=1 Tax=Radiomyces spectabilis TaxID=64574 RepID=UPI00221ED772|nr:uncharacterized protein BYT42DRAFT_488957 [Radiomyces spectabilis]KAI8393521.1 hypothetical protein BYT42DRAFT_488957 [Radiomyces spectabilis]
MRWETIKAVKGIPPCKRYGHTATLWNDHIIVFGGCNEYQGYCNDVHIFDIQKSTWHQPNISGSISARYLHSAVIYDDKLFVYGGFAKNSDCTYVLEEISVLDLKTLTWHKYHGVPPRYNHSATVINNKMYIYAGKDEHGNTVSDLFAINLATPPYTPHLILSGKQSSAHSQMVLLKSQHFCEAVCGKLLVFGRYLVNHQAAATPNPESMYGLWMLDLDTLEWQRQECNANFEVGGWNYFTVISERNRDEVAMHNLFFLGNTDPYRPQGYDHFRDALIINGESLGLYDILPLQVSHEFAQLLNNPELSDFMIVPANGQPLHVHQVILITRWPHFRNMYKSGMIEAQQRRMEIPEPYEVVLAFLKYLYSDQLDENEPWQVVCEVLVIANMYLLNRLKKICCERLYRQHLTVESCCLIFEKAILAEETGLKLLTLDYMFRNYGSVLKSNLLYQMPKEVRQEFLEAVPDEAVLEVSRSRSLPTGLSKYPATTAPAITAPPPPTMSGTLHPHQTYPSYSQQPPHALGYTQSINLRHGISRSPNEMISASATANSGSMSVGVL